METTKNQTNVYLVTFDGNLDPYGTETFLLGIYSTKELAEAAAKKFSEEVKAAKVAEFDVTADINTIILDHTYKTEIDDSLYTPQIYSLVYLGGYCE